MSQADAEAIARWHYPEPFSFYDWSADPDDLAELLTPRRRGGAYFAAEDEAARLIGFFAFKPKGDRTLDVGRGLHRVFPHWTNGAEWEFVEMHRPAEQD